VEDEIEKYKIMDKNYEEISKELELKKEEGFIRMNKKYFILFFLFLFSLNFISAFGFNVQSSDTGEFGFPKDVVTTEYVINASNHSNYWDTNDGSLDNINTDQFNNNGGILELVLNWFTDRFLENSGDTATGDFNGSTLTFNESKLSSTYINPTQSQIVRGTLDGGSLADVQHPDGKYDDITLNISEVSGSPGLDVRINITNVENFNRGILRYKTNSISGDYPIRQLWNYNTSSWEDYPPIGEVTNFLIVTEPIFDSSRYLQDGTVQIRFYKASNGNTQNHYYIDWL